MKNPEGKETKKAKILIVEDSEVQALALRNILVKHGYSVMVARNGAEGVSMATAQRPDIIISDIMMPVMDGYNMTRELKKDPGLRFIPVVLLTQLAEIDEVIGGLDSGAEYYVTKPYDEGYLLRKISALLEDPCQFTNNPETRATEFDHEGRHYSIRSGRGQTIGFLLSTYENAVIGNKNLIKAQEELQILNDELEKKVTERTKTLTAEVAERRHAEESLRESEERIRAVITAANDAIICIEPPDNISMWNNKAEEIFGYTAAEAIGKKLHDLIVPEKHRSAAKERLPLFFKTGEGDIIGKTREVNALKKDGTELTVELSVAAVKLNGAWNSIGTVRDITERKRLENEAKQNLNDVERMNKLMVGRELRMEELRQRSRELEEKLKALNGTKNHL
ncbi:MAG: PAS domain S-box protein [Deltaproteobacteria bacterium]